MSRLSPGEREFVSGFGELRPAPPTASPPAVVPMASAPLQGHAREIDARQLPAPLPLLEARRVLRSLRIGDEIRVLTGDPRSLLEFQALAKYETSIELVSQDVAGDCLVHVLRRRR